MIALRPALLTTLVLLGLAGCAAGEPITAASNCHTSDGQFVNAPGCTISYSTSRTVTTSTTTTTAVTTAPTEADDDRR